LAVTIGVKFWSTQPGYDIADPVLPSSQEFPGISCQTLFIGGTLLDSVKLARGSGPVPRWQVANFASRSRFSQQTSIASYYSPVGRGAWDEWGLSKSIRPHQDYPRIRIRFRT